MAGKENEKPRAVTSSDGAAAGARVAAIGPAEIQNTTPGAKPQYRLCKEDVSGIPAELKIIPRWVAWRWEWKDGKGWDKPPTQNGCHADAQDPDNWRTFDAVLAEVLAGKADGAGFVFADDHVYQKKDKKGNILKTREVVGDDISGTDLDDCRNPETGEIAAWAQFYVDVLKSYTEISPSGTGLKLFHRGAFPHSGPSGKKEMYTTGRYFTVTGLHLADTPAALEQRGENLLAVNAEIFRAKDKPKDKPKRPAGATRQDDASLVEASSPGNDLTDDELIAMAKNAGGGSGPKFSRVFGGDWETDFLGRGNQSSADLYICGRLAFWTNNDRARMDRLFRDSPALRDKWDEVHSRDGRTYGEMTLDKALDGAEPGYTRAKYLAVLNKGRVISATPAGATRQDDVPLVEAAAADLRAEVARLRAQMEAMQQRLAVLEAENASLHRERLQLLAVERNGAIKAERNVALAAIFEVASQTSRGHVDEEGYSHVYIGTDNGLAKLAGLSDKQVSTHLKRLADWGILDRQVRQTMVKEVDQATGQITGIRPRTETWIKLNAPMPETLDRLATLKPEKETTWGGARLRCPEHPDAPIIHRWLCGKCFRVLKETISELDQAEDVDADEERPGKMTGRSGRALPPPERVGRTHGGSNYGSLRGRPAYAIGAHVYLQGHGATPYLIIGGPYWDGDHDAWSYMLSDYPGDRWPESWLSPAAPAGEEAAG